MKGEGGPRDFEKGRQSFERGCNGGNALGCASLGFLYESGAGVKTDLASAAALYEQSCKAGSDLGCEQLARLRAARTPSP